jgi:uncharacterized protein YxjI
VPPPSVAPPAHVAFQPHVAPQQRSVDGSIDIAFQRDKFLLRQKRVSIKEKYSVADEHGRDIIYVERPQHLLQNVGALTAGVISGLLAGSVVGALAAAMPPGSGAAVAFVMFAILVGISTCCAVGLALSKKRHVGFYADTSKETRLLDVLQDKKLQLLTTTYTVRDVDGHILAGFQKKNLYNFIRRRWLCHAAGGELLCVAKEDSLVRSVLRRVLGQFLGPLAWALRTNFVLFDVAGKRLGEFNRQLTFFDRYVLDMSPDAVRSMDRRVALALGVMLDTGERR